MDGSLKKIRDFQCVAAFLRLAKRQNHHHDEGPAIKGLPYMSERAVKNSISISPELHSANLVSLDEHRTRSRKNSAPVSRSKPASSQVTFHRTELNAILRVYGFKVAEGEWRDYAIDHLRERAVFSIFRRASEMPIYRVEKNPKL